MADTALNPEYEEPEAFPVGAPDGGEASIEIEVLDDTPVEDRESPRPAADRLDPDSDEFEEEIKDYTIRLAKEMGKSYKEFIDWTQSFKPDFISYTDHEDTPCCCYTDGITICRSCSYC